MRDIFKTQSITEANKYQCGTFAIHSLNEAQKIAANTTEKGIKIMDANALLLNESQLNGAYDCYF